jgi:hypothetical protein
MPARSPAALTSAGKEGEVSGTSWFMGFSPPRVEDRQSEADG